MGETGLDEGETGLDEGETGLSRGKQVCRGGNRSDEV